MSRKSSLPAFGTGTGFQLSPPSVVLRMVAALPLAHATLSLTALMPRRRALTPVSCGVQAAAATSVTPAAADIAMTSPLNTRPRWRGLGFLIFRERRHQHGRRRVEHDRD